MKGCYILLMELPEDETLKIGKLGRIKFKKGFYAYVGSGMNNLEKRVERHLQKRKKLHWHIDYFLKRAVIKEVFYAESNKREECKIARKFAKTYTRGIKNFGCSDCKCPSHLFFFFR